MSHDFRNLKIGFGFKRLLAEREAIEARKREKAELATAKLLEKDIRAAMIQRAKLEENKEIKWKTFWPSEGPKVQKISKEKKQQILERIRNINAR